MRAVVLSDNRNIAFLNENFINTWVSNFELERTPNKKAYMAVRREQGYKPLDRMHPLAQGIMKGWKKNSPSDSLILSPDLELMGRMPVNELLGSFMIRDYLTFLKEALDGKLPGLVEEAPHNPSAVPIGGLNVVLTPQKPEQESLSIFRTPEPGYHILSLKLMRQHLKMEVCSRLIFLSGMLKLLVRLICLLTTVNCQHRVHLRMPLLQRGVFHLVKQTESYTPLIEVNLFGSELQVIGSVRKGALTLFLPQFL